MFVRWNLTVCSVTQSSLPIAAFESPARDCLENRELTLGQAGSLPEAVLVDLGQSQRVEDRSLDRLPDRRRQIERIHALDDVAARAVLERGLDPLGVAEDREHDHLHVGAVLPDLVQAREPVHLWHPHVEQHDVRLEPTNEGQHLAPRARLADDLDVFRRLERAPNSFDHQAMVIRNEDLHDRSSSLSRSGGANLPLRT